MPKKVEMLEIKDWIAKGLTDYDPSYIVQLIKSGDVKGWDVVGGTYRIPATKPNLKRLGKRQREKKVSRKNNSNTNTA